MKKALLLVLTAIFAIAVHAQPSEQFLFADEAIVVFCDMRDSLSQPPASAATDGPEFLQFNLLISVRQGDVYRSLIKRLEKYNRSEDEGTRRAALALTKAITVVQVANENQSNYLDSVLNNPDLLIDKEAISQKRAELSDAADTAWMTYGKVAALILTFALWKTNVLITRDEVSLLKSHLTSSFGPSVADGNLEKLADLPAKGMWHALVAGYDKLARP